jgi:antibiotic biosynthesis monooxygenase (ABM) superfamily enzyme
MFIVYVKHYLNDQGLQFFHANWFQRVQAIMSQQDGYISVMHDATRDSKDCVHVTVTFDDQKNLGKWAEHEDHDELVNALDIYRSRNYWQFACSDKMINDYEQLIWEKVETNF